MQQVRRTIGAAVVHQNQLIRHSRGGKSIIYRAEQQRQRSFFVVACHDNGKIHRKTPFRLITAAECIQEQMTDDVVRKRIEELEKNTCGACYDF